MKRDEFVTSDHHWGHANIIKYSKRPFHDVGEMNDALVHAWNNKVPPRAIVYYLGDLAFMTAEEIERLVKRLHGSIRFIKGNHDKAIRGGRLNKCFEWVKDYYESKTDDGVKVIMSHYPFLTWNGAHRGSWMLHGHSHGSLIDTGGRRLDVGVDTHPRYEPYSYPEIANIMRKREHQPVDHHGKRGT